jgi:uvrD/REP helicase
MSLIVYRASAGSGKTYTLALKYISLALKSGSKGFTHVLAVTFTNKATGEMKDRILENLYGLSRGLDANFLEDVKEITKLSEQEIQRKSTEMLCYIMNDFDHFRVETIDSFFQSLLTNLAFELGLTRGFKVDLDDKRVISIAVERILRRIDQEEKNGLRRIVKESLIRSLEDGKSWDIAKDLKAFAGKNLFKSEYVNNEKNITDLLNNGEMRKIKESILKSWSVLKDEKEKALQFVEQWVSDAEGDSSWKKQVVSTVKTFCGYVRDNSSKDVSSSVRKAAEDKDALLKNPGCDVALDKKAQQVSDYLEKLVDFYDNAEKYGRPYNTYQLAVENLDTLAFMGAISEEINHIVLEENTTLLAKTPLLFKNLVKDDIDQSFVFERAGTTFKHIMIDEFQDTSRVQWNNFEHLVNESTAQGEESLVVGDIKQSIYRWRGGDWDILYGFEDGNNTSVENLDTNYRSKPIVVRFNNVFFTKAAYILDQKENSWSVPANWLNEKDGYFVKADNSGKKVDEKNIEFCNLYNDTTQHIKPQYDKPEFINSGYVRLQTFEKSITDEEIMAEVFDKVVELKQKYNLDFDKMKMLVRTNNEGVKLIDYFAKRCEEEGVDIKLTSNEAYLFNASPALNALIFAMKRLLAPQDDLQRELFERYYNLLCEKAGKQAFFEDVKNDVEALLQDNEALDEIKRSPLYDLVMTMVQKLRLHDLLVKIDDKGKVKDGLGQSAYLFSFLDKVVDYLNDNSSDLKEFLDYWDETLSSQSITSNSNDAIEILTIHKAKGLAGHTVLIPFAGFSFVKNGRDGMIWCNPKDMSDDSEVKAQLSNLGLIPIKTAASKKVKNSDFKCFYDKELKQMTIDELNSLYVAFTRAKENMFIWSKEPSKNSTEPNAFMLINKFIDDCQVPVEGSEKNRVVEFGQLEYCANEEEKEGKEKRIVNPFSEDLKPQKVDVMIEQNNVLDLQFCQSKKAANFLFEAKDPNDISEEEKKQTQQNHYIETGVLMHQMMSLINRAEDVDHAYQQMVYDGLIAEGDSQFLSLKRKLKEQIATDETVKTWFDGTYENFNEKTILLCKRNSKRADRVMVSKDKAIVVDYKFGNHEKNEAYKAQVRDYMKIVGQLLELPTEGYLWYVYTNEVLPVPATK